MKAGEKMLKGEVKPILEYSDADKERMYVLMKEFYDNVDRKVFNRDFNDKDYCLTLTHKTEGLVGFTTQKVIALDVNGKTVHGMFSGDTIIHKDYWGSMELFRIWARFWFDFASRYEEFYWFLICKGHKTYRILPLFWTEFYPRVETPTPEFEQSILHAYAKLLFPDDYNPVSGVIEYKSIKDKLKEGVADIGEQQLRNRDTAYFVERNPGYMRGNDLVCLARIDKALLKPKVIGLLFK